jgi:hypothetical protein
MIAPHLEALAIAVRSQSENLRCAPRLAFCRCSQRLFPRLPELRALHPRLHIDIDTGRISSTASATLDAVALMTTPRPTCTGQLDQNTIRHVQPHLAGSASGRHRGARRATSCCTGYAAELRRGKGHWATRRCSRPHGSLRFGPVDPRGGAGPGIA